MNMDSLLPWGTFFRMIPFMLFGLLVHTLGKLVVARRRKDFTWRTFWRTMKWPWLLSFCYCLIGCYLFLRGIGSYGSSLWDVVGIFMGISGGSLASQRISRRPYEASFASVRQNRQKHQPGYPDDQTILIYTTE